MTIDITTMETQEKLAIVCLYFARLASDDVRYKGVWAPALKKLSETYKVKFSTLKQNKDRFDANFDNNGRRGYHQKPLEKAHKFLYQVYLKYRNAEINHLQQAVDEILLEAEFDKPFYSIKTKVKENIESILNRKSNIEVDGLNWFQNDLKEGQLVFIVFGGDSPPWDPGLIGMGEISRAPYDIGYKKRNYKVQIDVKVLLDKAIKRSDLVPFFDTYDIIGIGPITKWEPNQAITRVPVNKAVALMRAMLELSPSISEELSSIIDNQLMSRIKGSTVKLIPIEVDYGEKEPQFIEPETEMDEVKSNDNFADFYDPNIDAILDSFIMPANPIDNLKNLINIKKHIIMIGPPGTGKTTLAERVCEEAENTRYVSGYISTTAVSDWSTFDTIGGYMPDNEGKLQFQEGIFLSSIRENKWLIIDEINRADVDKAFGHLFTILSGNDVTLQYKAEVEEGSKYIRIRHSTNKGSYYDKQSATYFIGQNWRIIATMNTYDKNSLFVLSYAFMRRFAFVHIFTPSEEELEKIARESLVGHDKATDIVIKIINKTPKKIGTAIILDLVSYFKNAGETGMVDGICSLLIPQYEGISLHQIKKLYKDLGTLLNVNDRLFFKNYLCEFFDIHEDELSKVQFDIDEEEFDE